MLKNDIPRLDDIHMTEEQERRFWEFVLGDDLDFYEEYTIYLTDEQQQIFFVDNPDFMSEFPVSRGKMYLLRDKMFRDILRKIKRYEGGSA